jgi:hypothetical protein
MMQAVMIQTAFAPSRCHANAYWQLVKITIMPLQVNEQLMMIAAGNQYVMQTLPGIQGMATIQIGRTRS